MNKELADVIKIYSTGSHPHLDAHLLDKSKNTLIAILLDLLTMYINDKNSSTIREFVTVVLAGYEHKEGKIGYNGFRQNAYTSGKIEECEAKPKNFNTAAIEEYKSGKRKTEPSKLNGNGNFTDYTFGRLRKDKTREGLNMLVSGFVDGKLIYILEFPFRYAEFVQNLERQLKRRFKTGKDIPGEFLRSASFDYRHFRNCQNLNIIYPSAGSEIENYKSYLTGGFYNFLRSKTK